MILINNFFKDYRNRVYSLKYLNNNLIWYRFDQVNHDGYYLAFLVIINMINFIKDIKQHYNDIK